MRTRPECTAALRPARSPTRTTDGPDLGPTGSGASILPVRQAFVAAHAANASRTRPACGSCSLQHPAAESGARGATTERRAQHATPTAYRGHPGLLGTCSEPSTTGKSFRRTLARLLRSASACNEAQMPATTHRRQHARPSRHIAMSVPIPHNRSFPLHASLLTTPCSNLQPKPTQHQNQTNPNQTAFPLPPVRQRGKSPLVTHPLLPPVRQRGKSPLVKRAPFPLARHHHAGTLRLFHPFPSSLYQTWRTTLHQTRRITSTLTCLPSYSHMTHALPHISVSHPRLPG